MLTHSNNPLGNQALPEGKLELCALIVIGDTLRSEAPATLEYFARQEVDIKVISGDNPVTVASVAQRAGLKDADRLIDLSTLPTTRWPPPPTNTRYSAGSRPSASAYS